MKTQRPSVPGEGDGNMVGAGALNKAGPQAGAGGPVLEARRVSVRFGGVVALNQVDLNVPPGTVVGLIGPNGAGKSTLLAVLSGFLQPTRGTVLDAGRDITHRSAHWRARSGIARTFQHPEMAA